jgi:penicillin-binding protein 2
MVNASGEVLQDLRQQSAAAGNTIRLTLDLDTQQVVEEVLQDAIILANQLKNDDDEPTLLAERASAVVLEANTGAVVAMASYPSFEPEAFVGGIEEEEFRRLAELFAFNNLAIQGLKPPASTFKAVTYVTAIEEGVYPEGIFGPDQPIECSAELQALELADDASQLVYRNWTFPNDDGLQNIHTAFHRSCNIYFWEVALSIWDSFKNTEDEDLLQDWAFELGFGRPTQVDLPFENQGILPDRELFDTWRDEQPWRVRPEGWLGGDLMNISVGQGDILVTPLQLATAYAAMVNGGTVYQPRVVEAIVSPGGEIVRALEPRPLRDADLSTAVVSSLRADMEAVVSAGTARAAFEDSGLIGRVGGKTGTAQGFQDNDGRLHDSTAWFAGAAPIQNPQYVVIVMVDEGGSGGSVAAPAARAIFQHLMGVPRTELTPGEETD